MQKNVSGQKFRVFAFDATTNLPKSGDAANITVYASKDYGSVTATADTSASEEDATNAKGYYLVDAAQAETNADVINVTAKSSTANVVVIGAPASIQTVPPNWTNSSMILSSGTATAGGSDSITLQTALGADTRSKGMAVDLIGGTGAGQTRTVKSYVDSTKVMKVTRVWTTNPDNTTVYRVRYDTSEGGGQTYVLTSSGRDLDVRQVLESLFDAMGPTTGRGGATPSVAPPAVAAAGTAGWGFTFNITTGEKTGATYTPTAS